MSISNCTHKASLLLKSEAKLGEGPVWLAPSKQLLWVDINGGKVHCFTPESGEDSVIYQGQKTGCVVPVASGGFLVADLHDLLLFQGDLPQQKLVAGVESSLVNNRFNDGKVDPCGRLWVGTMSMSVVPHAGTLYCIESDGLVKSKLKGTTISNGMAWSADGEIMYYIDTADGVVYAFDFDQSTGDISNQRTVVNIPSHMGAPDGMTIDVEGNLWVALWGGGCVTRWNPATGELLATVNVDAPHVTCCTFGGDNMDQLFITTAREGLSSEQMEQYPLSGSLFSFQTQTQGFSPYEFIL